MLKWLLGFGTIGLLVAMLACQSDGAKTTFKMEQRTTRQLPNFEEMSLTLGDIKGGQSASFELRMRDRTIATGVLFEGYRIPFEHDGKPYSILVRKLVDAPLLDDRQDWAKFKIVKGPSDPGPNVSRPDGVQQPE